MKEQLNQNKNRLLLSMSYVLGWSFFLLIQAKLLQDLGITAPIAWGDAFSSSITLALISYLIVNNMRYYLPGKERYWYVCAKPCYEWNLADACSLHFVDLV